MLVQVQVMACFTCLTADVLSLIENQGLLFVCTGGGGAVVQLAMMSTLVLPILPVPTAAFNSSMASFPSHLNHAQVKAQRVSGSPPERHHRSTPRKHLDLAHSSKGQRSPPPFAHNHTNLPTFPNRRILSPSHLSEP